MHELGLRQDSLFVSELHDSHPWNRVDGSGILSQSKKHLISVCNKGPNIESWTMPSKLVGETLTPAHRLATFSSYYRLQHQQSWRENLLGRLTCKSKRPLPWSGSSLPSDNSTGRIAAPVLAQGYSRHEAAGNTGLQTLVKPSYP